MLIPVRCFSCGKPISNQWQEYTKLLEKYNKNEKEVVLDIENFDTKAETASFKALKDLKINRICCRRHFIANVDMIDVI